MAAADPLLPGMELEVIRTLSGDDLMANIQ